MAAREALGLSPVVKAGWAHASDVARVPIVPTGTEPFVIFARRPATERTADAWFRWFPVAFNFTVGGNGGSISRWTHLIGSLNSLFFGKAAPIPPDHTHFLATQTSVLDRHAEEHVFVLLVIGCEGVLVK